MWRYKSCPRCRGDVFIDEDIDRTYIKCLQCGYEKELTRRHLVKKDRAAVVAIRSLRD